MKRYQICLILLCAIEYSFAAVYPTARIPLTGVTYRGIIIKGVEFFLNIPFGKDTGGSGRFAPPQPYAPASNSTICATANGPACPQQKVPLAIFPLFSNVTWASEDCLNLRIARPLHTATDAKLPVMVYIFGGGASFGQIYDGLYDPTSFILGAAAAETPIIYVAANYRTNIFGFAVSEELRKEDSLNVGLLDQRLSLEWVKQNIEYFGGDPDNVTIFGESFGANSVALQMTAYGGEREVPFQKAIMQSGGPTGNDAITSNTSAEHYAVIAERLNCTSDNTNDKMILRCLRDVPMEKLLDFIVPYELEVNSLGFLVFFPTIDGSFIPDAPSKLVRDGSFSKNVSVIMGWNENDGSLLIPSPLQLTSEKALRLFLTDKYTAMTSCSIDQILELFPLVDFPGQLGPVLNVSGQYFRASQIVRDIMFTCPAIGFSHAVSKHGSTAYLYTLNQTALTSIFASLGASWFGVSHLSDVPYVFNDANNLFNFTKSDKILAKNMLDSWSLFATKGDPSLHSSPSSSTWQDWPSAFHHHYLGLAGSIPEEPTINIIGGPDAGLSRMFLSNGTKFVEDKLAHEKLVERCTFFNSLEISAQIQT